MGYLFKSIRAVPKVLPTLVIDSREKLPWELIQCKYTFKRVRKPLKTGDYSFVGYEDTVCIEKKAGLAEFMTNISITDKARFIATLERLSKFKVKYFVIEDSIEHLTKRVKANPKNARVSEYGVLYWIFKIIGTYKIPVIFIGTNLGLKKAALAVLFEQIIEVDIPNLNKGKQ